MSISKMSIEKIKPEVYVEKMIEFTNNFVKVKSCNGMRLIASKNNNNNCFSTSVIAEESDFKYHPKLNSSILESEIDFDSLLTLTNEMYKIIGSRMNPALIINNFCYDNVIVNFQMMGDWNFSIRNLSNEQMERMSSSLNSIQEKLLEKNSKFSTPHVEVLTDAQKYSRLVYDAKSLEEKSMIVAEAKVPYFSYKFVKEVFETTKLTQEERKALVMPHVVFVFASRDNQVTYKLAKFIENKPLFKGEAEEGKKVRVP